MKLRIALLVASAAMVVSSPALASTTIKHDYWFDKSVLGATIKDPSDLQVCDTNCRLAPNLTANGPVILGFEGNSQYQNAQFGRNFIPPDTMGAVGGTQYMVTTNGSYGIYDKYTGVNQSLVSDNSFWAAAGGTTTNGDTRIMYNAQAERWVMVAFGANVANLQVAVSDTDNALGGWKSVTFQGYAGLGFGGTADYPTLALDTTSVYIGTNNFAPATAGGANSFRGTTLNVIPIDSLFNLTGPTVDNFQQFVTDFPGTFEDRGFAQQGVNSSTVGSTGNIFAASLFDFDSLTFRVNGLSSTSATGATLGAVQFVGESAFDSPGDGRQPADIAANRRIIDTLDERISSSVYEANGYIFAVHTVNPTEPGGPAAQQDYSRVRVMVVDAATQQVVDEYDIGTGEYDYYQGSIAVNAAGDIVVGFNRSGLSADDGRISFRAQILKAGANGELSVRGGELVLKDSLTNDYHNGSLKGQAAAGRQRWGDYSQVSLDPTDANQFYLIGQFAREYNTPEDGHPGGTGGSRWSTWVAVVNVAGVPEPSAWLMMILGFGVIGGAIRRQKLVTKVTYA